ncbi:unnamed protein product, partial [Ectocarpus sp. 12 AP-2014]
VQTIAEGTLHTHITAARMAQQRGDVLLCVRVFLHTMQKNYNRNQSRSRSVVITPDNEKQRGHGLSPTGGRCAGHLRWSCEYRGGH